MNYLKCNTLVLTVLVLLISVSTSHAQMSIGAPRPDQSSQLDVISEDKGILIPRVSLQNVTDQITITNGNVESLLVFNTTDSEHITPGYYYWFENKWHRLTNEDDRVSSELTKNPDGSYTHISGSGVTTQLSVGGNLVKNGDGSYTFTDSKGDEVIIEKPSVSTLVENADGSYTYTNEDGTKTELAKETTSTLVKQTDGSYVYTNEEGNTVSLSVGGNLVKNTDGSYTFTDSKGDEVIIEKPSVSTLVKNADGSYTYTNEDGTKTELAKETTSTLVKQLDGSYVYTNEKGVETSLPVGGNLVENADGTYTFTKPDGSIIIVKSKAKNGLNVESTSNTIKLGGELTEATTITTKTGNTLTIDGSSDLNQKALIVKGDVDITGVLDPTKLVFSNAAGTHSSYIPNTNGQYEIEFNENLDLNFKSNSKNDILDLSNNGHIGISTPAENENEVTIDSETGTTATDVMEIRRNNDGLTGSSNVLNLLDSNSSSPLRTGLNIELKNGEDTIIGAKKTLSGDSYQKIGSLNVISGKVSNVSSNTSHINVTTSLDTSEIDGTKNVFSVNSTSKRAYIHGTRGDFNINPSGDITRVYGSKNSFNTDSQHGARTIAYGAQNIFNGHIELGSIIGNESRIGTEGKATLRGYQSIIASTSTGEHIGFSNTINGDSSASKYGIKQLLGGEGAKSLTGYSNKISANKSGETIGIYTLLNVKDATGRQVGSRINIESTLTLDSLKLIGTEVEIKASNSNEVYGNKVKINSNNSSGNQYGMFIDWVQSNQGTGKKVGVYSKSDGAGNLAAQFIGNVEISGSLIVNGTVVPDYVFQKYYNGYSKLKDDYEFMSLDKVEKFVKENHHLPGVSSNEEAETNGFNLGEAPKQNLEKIEELFLHTIEQNKVINELTEDKIELTNQLDEQAKQIETLQNQVQMILKSIEK